MNVPPSLSLLTLKLEAVGCTGMLVLAYEQIPEDHNLNVHHTENSRLGSPVLLQYPTRLVQWYWSGLVFMRHLVCILVVFIYTVGLWCLLLSSVRLRGESMRGSQTISVQIVCYILLHF